MSKQSQVHLINVPISMLLKWACASFGWESRNRIMALNKLLTRHARFATAISRYFRNNPPHHDRVAVVLVVGCVQITVATTPSAFGQTELLYSPRCMARFRIMNAIRLEYEIVRMSERTRVNNEPLVVVALWPSVVCICFRAQRGRHLHCACDGGRRARPDDEPWRPSSRAHPDLNVKRNTSV